MTLSETKTQLADNYMKFADLVEKVIRNFTQVLGFILVVWVTTMVITRHGFEYVPVWGLEISAFLMVWIVFLLIGPLVYTDNHLQIKVFFNKIPMPFQYYFRMIQLSGIFVLGAILLEYGVGYAVNSGLNSVSPGLGIYLFWAYLVIPISGCLIMFFTVARAIAITRDKTEMEPKEFADDSELNRLEDNV
ncbi:TRAP transporter small permease [Halalkalicoccus tibetensis]|uniref:TRAP transporter small permease n=1 Tax=Halalkalicoccus tibetensis TaxID=175632 RepID=A0ABD5VB14_9EURY